MDFEKYYFCIKETQMLMGCFGKPLMAMEEWGSAESPLVQFWVASWSVLGKRQAWLSSVPWPACVLEKVRSEINKSRHKWSFQITSMFIYHPYIIY